MVWYCWHEWHNGAVLHPPCVIASVRLCAPTSKLSLYMKMSSTGSWLTEVQHCCFISSECLIFSPVSFHFCFIFFTSLISLWAFLHLPKWFCSLAPSSVHLHHLNVPSFDSQLLATVRVNSSNRNPERRHCIHPWSLIKMFKKASRITEIWNDSSSTLFRAEKSVIILQLFQSQTVVTALSPSLSPSLVSHDAPSLRPFTSPRSTQKTALRGEERPL